MFRPSPSSFLLHNANVKGQAESWPARKHDQPSKCLVARRDGIELPRESKFLAEKQSRRWSNRRLIQNARLRSTLGGLQGQEGETAVVVEGVSSACRFWVLTKWGTIHGDVLASAHVIGIEMRNRHDDHFVRLRNDLKGSHP